MPYLRALKRRSTIKTILNFEVESMIMDMKIFLLSSLFVVCYTIPIPPDQLLSWLVPEICPKDCPRIEIQVCGTNGMTYTNECFLKQANCSSNTLLEVKNFGQC